MNCKKCKYYMVDYLVGELGDSEKQEIDMHLEKCKRCRHNFTEYQSVIIKSKSIPAPVFDDAFWEQRLRELGNYKKNRRFRLLPVIVTSAVTVVLLFIFLFRPFSLFDGNKIMVAENNKGNTVFNTLSFSEERLLEIIDYIDEKSAEDLLDILFKNNIPLVYSAIQ